MITPEGREDVLLALDDTIPCFNERAYHEEYEVVSALVSGGARVLAVDIEGDEKRDMHVNWVTQPSKLNQSQKMHAYYGNAPEACYTYNSFCLFVEIGKPGMRSVQPELEPPLDGSDSNEQRG